jgi:hypothetical protein
MVEKEAVIQAQLMDRQHLHLMLAVEVELLEVVELFQYSLQPYLLMVQYQLMVETAQQEQEVEVV